MRCKTCGTHIFEPGEPVDVDARLAALKAAVVEAAMLAWDCGLYALPTNVAEACAALRAASPTAGEGRE